jgi:hypothetical protein
MIYGHPSIHVDDDLTDRIGIRTLILSQLWQASRWPLSLEELESEQPPIPAVPGGVQLIGQQTRPMDGVLRTIWTFEGINGSGKSVTFKDRKKSNDYAFEAGFAEKSILLLPNILDLLDQYGGQPVEGGEILWPQFVPKSSKGAGLSGASREKEGDINPMRGQQTFFSVEGTYTFRYVDWNPPGKDRVGEVHKTGELPGQAPRIPGRNWLKLPPSYRRRGPVFDITETYWLSGIDGWLEQIYGKKKNGNSATDFTSGDLLPGADAAPPVRLQGSHL